MVSCLGALPADYAPLSRPTCRRNTIVKQRGYSPSSASSSGLSRGSAPGTTSTTRTPSDASRAAPATRSSLGSALDAGALAFAA